MQGPDWSKLRHSGEVDEWLGMLATDMGAHPIMQILCQATLRRWL